MSPYIPRYPGPRWSIRYGVYEGVQKFALEELNRAVQVFLPYVVGTGPAAAAAPLEAEENLILLGTPEDNPAIHDRPTQRHPPSRHPRATPGLPSLGRRSQRRGHRRRSPAAVLYGVRRSMPTCWPAGCSPKRTASLSRALDEMGEFASRITLRSPARRVDLGLRPLRLPALPGRHGPPALQR
jgi:hypothetical protein